jgi:hypothetical protein
MDWLPDEVPGPNGPMRVVREPRNDMPFVRLSKNPPNLILHTTEGGTSLGTAYRVWDHPPQFAVGDGKIVQLFPTNCKGYSVDTQDDLAMQVEIAENSRLALWLPSSSSLEPLVALMAFLHKHGLVTTAVRRPDRQNWPLVLDRLPAAVDTYYRRHGPWPATGVYGHVEIPDDEHWDPGSLNYPGLFAMVESVLDGGDAMTPEELNRLKDVEAGMRGVDDFLAGSAPPDTADHERKQMFRALTVAASRPAPLPGPAGPTGPKGEKGDPGDPAAPHSHTADTVVHEA